MVNITKVSANHTMPHAAHITYDYLVMFLLKWSYRQILNIQLCNSVLSTLPAICRLPKYCERYCLGLPYFLLPDRLLVLFPVYRQVIATFYNIRSHSSLFASCDNPITGTHQLCSFRQHHWCVREAGRPVCFCLQATLLVCKGGGEVSI